MIGREDSQQIFKVTPESQFEKALDRLHNMSKFSLYKLQHICVGPHETMPTKCPATSRKELICDMLAQKRIRRTQQSSN